MVGYLERLHWASINAGYSIRSSIRALQEWHPDCYLPDSAGPCENRQDKELALDLMMWIVKWLLGMEAHAIHGDQRMFSSSPFY